MLKGLAITPPVIGRIVIGRVIEKDGKRLPEKDDQFTLTTQIQQRGEWLLHPLNEALRKTGADKPAGKLRALPVRFLFADPELNLRASYARFERKSGRPVCAGNGETCRRATENGIETLPCPSPDGCALGPPGDCKPYGRLNVLIGDEDEMGSFIFRTTSYNSIRTLAARLHYFAAVSGNLLACLPLELKLRGKSTTQSLRAPVYYVDLGVRAGSTLEQALGEARERDTRRKSAGFDQAALDVAARAGFASGAFEDSAEEGAAVVGEFYPPISQPTNPSITQGEENGAERDDDDGTAPSTAGGNDACSTPSKLQSKLDRRAASLRGMAA